MAITLKAARVNAKLTQPDAAKALGISASTLYKYEKGKAFPNALTIQKMEDLYGIRYDELIFLPNSTI